MKNIRVFFLFLFFTFFVLSLLRKRCWKWCTTALYCNTQASEKCFPLYHPWEEFALSWVELSWVRRCVCYISFFLFFFFLVWSETAVSASVYTSLQRRKNETHVVRVAPGLGVGQGRESVLQTQTADVHTFNTILDVQEDGKSVSDFLYLRGQTILMQQATPTHTACRMEKRLATSNKKSS